MKPSVLRFFLVVARPGGSFVLVALLLVVFAIYLAVVAPTQLEQPLGIAIFLQLFAASTGYRDRLRRGHFDPILVGRPNPWRIAAAHWAVSAGLGIVAWMVLAVIELAARPSVWPTALAPAEIAAFLYVSAAVWTLTLALPRYSGALVWLVSLIVLANTQYLQAMRVRFTPVPETWMETFRSAGSVFVFPVFLLINPAAAGASLLAFIAVGTAIVWAVGAAMIGRFEAALVEDQ